MGKQTMMGSFECRDGEAAAMTAVLEQMVEAAREEPGCEIYSYHRGEGNTFWFFALMTDAESMQLHGRTEAMQQAMAAFQPLVAGPPKMSGSEPIAAIGLDL